VSGQSAPWATSSVPRTLTVADSADAKVVKGQPNANFGTVTGLIADGSPAVRSLMRFDVAGVGTGTVTKATLRVFTTNASPVGGVFAGTDGASWTESTVNWTTQPQPGPAVATLGPVTSGGYVDVDVTPLVTHDGTVDISVTSTNADSVTYASREATAARRPTLTVTVG
jgi:hypothetical protein